MAWYNVDYTCGHTERVQLYGPERERQRKIAYAERNNVCSACFVAEQDRQREVALTQAKEEAAAAALPALVGSPKQVAWAETIRAAAKGHLEYVVGVVSGCATAEHDHPTQEEVVAFAQRVLRQTESKYWIDRRGEFASPKSMALYVKKSVVEERAKAAGAAVLKGGN